MTVSRFGICVIFAVALQLTLPLFSSSQNTVPVIDINKSAFKIIYAGENPDFIAKDEDNAWIVDDGHSRILKLSTASKSPLLTVSVPGACTAPIVGFGSVWVMSCTSKTLYKIYHANGRIIAKIPTGLADSNGEMSLSVGAGFVWLLSDSSGILLKIDPVTNTIKKKIPVKPNSYCTAFGYNSIWISNYHDNSIQRIDPVTGSVTATIPAGNKPRFITAGEKGVWALNQGDGTVSRIDPSVNKVAATIDVKATGNGGDITAGGGKVWVISTNTIRPVQVIDPLSNTVETIYSEKPVGKKNFKVDGAVRLSKNYVWISGYYSKRVWLLKK